MEEELSWSAASFCFPRAALVGSLGGPMLDELSWPIASLFFPEVRLASGFSESLSLSLPHSGTRLVLGFLVANVAVVLSRDRLVSCSIGIAAYFGIPRSTAFSLC